MPKTNSVSVAKALVSTKAVVATKAANTLRNLIRIAADCSHQQAKMELRRESLKSNLAKGFRAYCGKGWEAADKDSVQGKKRDAMIKELYLKTKEKGKAEYDAARKLIYDTKAFARDGYKPKASKSKGKGNKGRKPGEKDSFNVFFEKQIRPILVRYYTDANTTDRDESAMEHIRFACAVYKLDISKEMAMAPKAEAKDKKPKTK
jgi:hypothetical protein